MFKLDPLSNEELQVKGGGRDGQLLLDFFKGNVLLFFFSSLFKFAKKIRQSNE